MIKVNTILITSNFLGKDILLLQQLFTSVKENNQPYVKVYFRLVILNAGLS